MAKSKRMRLPNGFGQISEIKGRKLRKPFRAMVTVGKTPEGRPICKTLKPVGYFKTYNEAYSALQEYNKDPFAIDKTCTMDELYKRWFKEYQEKGRSESAITTARLCWEYCRSIYSLQVPLVRVKHMKACIEGNLEKKPTKFYQQKIKILLKQLLDYAIELELVDHNWANDIRNIEENPANYTVEHRPFADDEIAKLWNSTEEIAKMTLIQCYSGWRPQELILLKISNVDLTEWSFTGGMKTANGTSRKIPIHTRIRPLVKEAYEKAQETGSEYLFPYRNYDSYRHFFLKAIKRIGIDDHKPHDGRKHFVTMAKKSGCDEYAIKRIVGHSISDLTERVYTERDLDWLRKEIEKIV